MTKTISTSFPRLEEFFEKMEEAKWDIYNSLVWGYFFIDENKTKLEVFSEKLQKEGFQIVELRKVEDEKKNSYTLHISENTIHTPQSLLDQNNKLSKLAIDNDIDIYDGWDVG